MYLQTKERIPHHKACVDGNTKGVLQKGGERCQKETCKYRKKRRPRDVVDTWADIIA